MPKKKHKPNQFKPGKGGGPKSLKNINAIGNTYTLTPGPSISGPTPHPGVNFGQSVIGGVTWDHKGNIHIGGFGGNNSGAISLRSNRTQGVLPTTKITAGSPAMERSYWTNRGLENFIRKHGRTPEFGPDSYLGKFYTSYYNPQRDDSSCNFKCWGQEGNDTYVHPGTCVWCPENAYKPNENPEWYWDTGWACCGCEDPEEGIPIKLAWTYVTWLGDGCCDDGDKISAQYHNTRNPCCETSDCYYGSDECWPDCATFDSDGNIISYNNCPDIWWDQNTWVTDEDGNEFSPTFCHCNDNAINGPTGDGTDANPGHAYPHSRYQGDMQNIHFYGNLPVSFALLYIFTKLNKCEALFIFRLSFV